MSAAGLVDWGTAHALAGRIAGGEEPASDAEIGRLATVGEQAEDAVRSLSRLEPREPLPQGEWVSRREWARIKLRGIELTLAELPGPTQDGEGIAAIAGAAAGAVLGRLGGLQIGLLAGLASRNVLGQYEYPLLGPDRPTRLLYVRANLIAAQERLGAGPEPLLAWVALHETTHAVHFASAPWLRDHLGGLARQLLGPGRLNPDLGELAGRARELLGGDLSRLPARLRESDPLALLVPARARPSIEAIQATMSVVEGYAEHVMDAALPQLGYDPAPLRARIEQRRHERPPHARLLAWLLGLEPKLRQYREGKRFCDTVVDAAGIEALNRAWDGAPTLPSRAELSDPERWLARTEAPSATL
jgi:coenzyme F420 biosynthesis associated uncharacterized protein